MSTPLQTQSARAVVRDVRITAPKARRVVDLVRGRRVGDADAILAFAPQDAAGTVRKLLASAVANAESLHGTGADDLVVTTAFVDEGGTWKRVRARSRSQAFRILKRTCHITLVVGPADRPSPRRGSSTSTRKGNR